jgi:hypothetical protein
VDIQSSFDPESMTLTIPLLIGTFMYDRSLFVLCLNLGESKISESNLDIILHIMFQFLDIYYFGRGFSLTKIPSGFGSNGCSSDNDDSMEFFLAMHGGLC